MNPAAVFDEVNATFTAQDAVRDTLRRHRDALHPPQRALQHALALLHTTPALAPAVLHVRDALRAMGEPLRALEAALPDEPGAHAKYGGLWNEQVRACVRAAVVVGMLESGGLVGGGAVVEMVGGGVTVRAEEYVEGVCGVMPFVGRLCMNRVVGGDFGTCGECARFAQRVVEAFGGMDLQNEFLRKRHEGMRADLKRIEEIMYDLSLRGLVKDAGSGLEDAKVKVALE